jgi:hypothetical protein
MSIISLPKRVRFDLGVTSTQGGASGSLALEPPHDPVQTKLINAKF